MLEWFLYIFLFGIGLAVGSFVNVLVLRFGFSESSEARSHCMSCGVQITSIDLIPVASYVLLQGRCRFCGSGLSLQYPLVEAGTAFLFVLAYLFVPPPMDLWSLMAFVSLLVFLAGLVALVVYDIRHTLVPLPFVFVLIGSAFSAIIFQSIFSHSFVPLLDGIIGGATLATFFALLHFITRGRGMGLGDAYVAGSVGLLLGFARGVEAVMFAVWVGTAVYLLVMFLSSLFRRSRLLPQNPRVTITTELPFVPFLALGCLLALFTDLSPLAFGTWLATTLWPI